MKKFALAVVLMASATVNAMAADIAVKAPPPAPPAGVVASGWGGFYAGGNAGWVWQHGNGTSDFTQPFAPPPLLLDTANSNSPSNNSIILGGQIGYNWQFAPAWVLGVEGDWQWTDAKNSFCRETDTHFGSCTDFGAGYLTISSNTDWLATARARLGFIWNGFMIYGTGGGAWAKIDTTFTVNCAVNGCGRSVGKNTNLANFTDTQGGWAAGAGIETMLMPNWTAKAEWLHIDLGSLTNSFTSAANVGSYGVSWSRDLKYDIFRVGLNYHFGDPGPAFAKY